jgi:hypothetical protein
LETADAIRSESAFVNYPIVVGQEKIRHQVYRDLLNRGFVGLSLYPNVHETEGYTSIDGSHHDSGAFGTDIADSHEGDPSYADELAVAREEGARIKISFQGTNSSSRVGIDSAGQLH